MLSSEDEVPDTGLRRLAVQGRDAPVVGPEAIGQLTLLGHIQ